MSQEPFIRPIVDTAEAWRAFWRRQIAEQRGVPVECVTISDDGMTATVAGSWPIEAAVTFIGTLNGNGELP